jgi:hypothetical protein
MGKMWKTTPNVVVPLHCIDDDLGIQENTLYY